MPCTSYLSPTASAVFILESRRVQSYEPYMHAATRLWLLTVLVGEITGPRGVYFLMMYDLLHQTGAMDKGQFE